MNNNTTWYLYITRYSSGKTALDLSLDGAKNQNRKKSLKNTVLISF